VPVVKRPVDVESVRPEPGGMATADRPSRYFSEFDTRSKRPFSSWIARTRIVPSLVSAENSEMSSYFIPHHTRIALRFDKSMVES